MTAKESEKLIRVEEKQISMSYRLEKMDKKIDKIVDALPLKADTAYVNAEMRKLSRQRWVQNILSAILGVVLAILVGEFLKGSAG